MTEPLPTAFSEDTAARQTALDPARSFIVEAPAGSGKTGLLVQRFLQLLSHPSVERPEEVLAMTFTRKATAEMRERVLHALHTAHTHAPLPDSSPHHQLTRSLAHNTLARSAALGWDLLAQPQRLNIRGITSVCVDLSNALPLLAGSCGPMRPLDDPKPLYRLAARRTLQQLAGTDPDLHHALTTLLLHRDASLADTAHLLAEMLETRDQWGELIPLAHSFDDAWLDAHVRPQLERTLHAIAAQALQRLQDTLPPHALAHLTAFAQTHAHLPGYKDLPSPIAPCRDLHTPPTDDPACLHHWLILIHLLLTSNGSWRRSLAVNHIGFKPPKAVLDELQLFIDSIQNDALQTALLAVRNLPPLRYPEEQWNIARALFRVLRRALVELRLLFAARGECDFTELALNARSALASQQGQSPEPTTDLALAAGGRLRHLLVDEMQDTSISQYQLIEALTHSWDGHSQTVFLVGDPKQSIYLFRQARVERFIRTLHERHLGQLPLVPLRLTTNFRSQARLVRHFNDTFGGSDTGQPIFPSPDDPALLATDAVDVPFVHAHPSRPDSQPEGLVWHTDIHSPSPDSRPGPSSSPAPHLLEAQLVRRILDERLHRPLPPDRDGQSGRPHSPWTFAILARSRPHLRAIVQQLAAHDGLPEIPFRAVDIDPLNERPEVLDILALTRALLHPGDRTAWLAVLHAPWCGLGLADLLTLTGDAAATSDTVAHLVAAHAARLSSDGRRQLDRAWPVLTQAVATLGRSPLAVHVERTWRSLGADAALTPDQLTNVQRFLTALADLAAESTTAPDLDTLDRQLRTLFAQPRTGDIHVDCMTIHSAKGLEWDFVLVPGLHRPPRRNNTPLLQWVELNGISPAEDATVLLAPIHGKGDDSGKLNEWIRAVRSRRDRAEEKRLFYVACTRAREELHLFATLTLNAKGALPKPRSGSLLSACWPAAEAHFRSRLLARSLTDELLHTPTDGTPGDASADQPLTLAAAAAEPRPPQLLRLPQDFNPLQRFEQAFARRLDYPLPTALQQPAHFDRPEGSFAARAFGNVVHRYLQQLALRLASATPEHLLAELPTWNQRLETALRSEGLPPALSAREAPRALRALTATLNDPTGRWILSPHPQASSEQELRQSLPSPRSLRVDRLFLAGPAPNQPGSNTLWIIDFKTSGLVLSPDSTTDSPTDAAAREIARYRPQLEAYATLHAALTHHLLPIRLALFYPLQTQLLHWPWQPPSADSDTP